MFIEYKSLWAPRGFLSDLRLQNTNNFNPNVIKVAIRGGKEGRRARGRRERERRGEGKKGWRGVGEGERRGREEGKGKERERETER